MLSHAEGDSGGTEGKNVIAEWKIGVGF